MKSHEETWVARKQPGFICTEDGEIIADVVGFPDVDDGGDSMEKRTLLMAAAPDMARALLGIGNGTLFHRDGEEMVVRIPRARWDAIGAALKKAGVIP